MSSKLHENIARAGYSAKTVMYSMLGIFILSLVINTLNREKASQSHVFSTLKEQPFGQVILGLLIVGLACYALWRWLQVFYNRRESDEYRFLFYINQIFFVVSGLFYFGAAYLGAKTLLSIGSKKSGQSSGEQTSEYLLQYEWGIIVVAAIGVCVLIFACVQFKHAVTADFMDKFSLTALSGHVKASILCSGRVGYAARGIVYILVGSFFVISAVNSNPSQAGGLRQALSTLMEQPFGPYLIMGVGAGFLLFGIYCGLEARYRNIGNVH